DDLLVRPVQNGLATTQPRRDGITAALARVADPAAGRLAVATGPPHVELDRVRVERLQRVVGGVADVAHGAEGDVLQLVHRAAYVRHHRLRAIVGEVRHQAPALVPLARETDAGVLDVLPEGAQPGLDDLSVASRRGHDFCPRLAPP